MLLQVVLTGLVVGCLYALAGLGLVVIDKTSEIINFSQGDTSTLTTLIAFTLLVSSGMPYPIVLVLVAVAAGAAGVLIYGLAVRPLMGSRSPLDAVVATLGVASNLCAAYLSTDLKTTFVFALMLSIFAIRPAGLLGSVGRTKV